MAYSLRERIAGAAIGLLLVPLALALAGGSAEPSDRRIESSKDDRRTAGKPVAIRVADGRAAFQIPASRDGADCLLIVSSLARSSSTFPVRLEADHVQTTGKLEGEIIGPLNRTPRAQQGGPEPIAEPTPTIPRQERSFDLMVKDGDVTSASNYLKIRGTLRGVGKRIQVYVAVEDAGLVGDDLVNDVITTFDDKVFEFAGKNWGTANDIDRDGRFTILLSSWLARLGNGRNAVDGFVRVTDLDTSLPAPFSNHCDMMYLSTSLRPGPHLRTVMAHEYMHAVLFSRKSRHRSEVHGAWLEEEGWLDEAIAHLAEDDHGFSKSNLDYRVSAYLSQPEAYRLVVEDYYAADLFRSHGNRGCTYLFMKWCVDQYGASLVRSLLESSLKGVANLERATGASFADLYRRWTIATALSGLEASGENPVESYRTIDLRSSLGEWELAGPRTTRVTPGGAADVWEMVGTSSHFAIVSSSPQAATEIRVTGPAAAELQVTAIPLPAGLSGLDVLAGTTVDAEGGLRLRAEVKETNGAAVRLSAITWEPLVPPTAPHAAGFRRGGLDEAAIIKSFGGSQIAAGGSLRSGSIPLKGAGPADAPLVLKVIGKDQAGRRVAGWARLDREASLASGRADGTDAGAIR